MSELRIPGVAVAVVVGSRIETAQAFGLSDPETNSPVTLDTQFSLQSVSKTMAAWAIMHLAERKLLDLDASILTYLTSFRPEQTGDFSWEEVTLRRLLSHHAGVTERGFRGAPAGAEPHDLRSAFQGRLPPMTEEQRRYYAHWNLVEDGPVELVRRPGAGWLYSNVGFGLLECALEDVTGADYADFVTRTVLRPLGMAKAGFEPPSDALLARPHTFGGAPTGRYVFPCKAAAGCYSDIVDLANFAIAEIEAFNSRDGAPGLLSQQAVHEMFEPIGMADSTPEVQFQTGLGHLSFTAKGHRFITHSGGSLGWRSVYCIQPQTERGFCALMNSDQANDLWIGLMRGWIDATF